MLLDGIKGLLIQTPLRGVLRLKGMSEIQATLSCICGNVSNGYAVQGSSKFWVKLLLWLFKGELWSRTCLGCYNFMYLLKPLILGEYSYMFMHLVSSAGVYFTKPNSNPGNQAMILNHQHHTLQFLKVTLVTWFSVICIYAWPPQDEILDLIW